jgi:ribonuclease E
MKRMLINATQPEELRVALVDGQSIYDFDIEQVGQERKRANIYKGRVSRAEQSLGAAFVDFGSEKHGFLPFKDLAPQYLKNKNGKNTINECLSQGQEIIIQVEKEERGTKGAAISTFISLPGHYLVLMPNSPEAGGISKSIEGESRDEMRRKMRDLDIPDGMGAILRTAGEGVSQEDLQWDLDYLLNLWDAITEADQTRKAPFLIYRENDLVSRSLRDFLRSDITEVLVDTDEAYEKAFDFASKLMPDFEDRIKRYDESTPLFTRYQIESQIETAYQREVRLPSGGSLVIDQTEALVAIDINSAKSTKGSGIEDTAVSTNLEAAVEIAKQLRLRDMGGLIVIDFIDMLSLKNKRAVEDKLWSALSIDRAKTQVGRISRFGLMEMSRQRLRPSLQERWTQDVASLSTAVLRLIEEEAGKKGSGEVRAVVSPDMSIFLLNERRPRVNEIEEKTGVRIVVVSDPTRSDNRFEVSRLKEDDKNLKDSASYKIQEKVESTSQSSKTSQKKVKIETPAVNIKPPKKPKRKTDGFFKKLLKSLTPSKPEEKKRPSRPSSQRRNNRNPNANRNPNRSSNNRSSGNKPSNKKPNDNRRDDRTEADKNKKTDDRRRQKPKINDSQDSKQTETRKPADNQRKSPEKIDNKVREDKEVENTVKRPAPKPRKPRQPRAEKEQKSVEVDGNKVDGNIIKAVDEVVKVEIDGNKAPTTENQKTRPSKAMTKPESKPKPKPKPDSKIDKNLDVKLKPKAIKEKTKVTAPVKKIEKTEAPEKKAEVAKKAQDWGRAANDPRNKK